MFGVKDGIVQGDMAVCRHCGSPKWVITNYQCPDCELPRIHDRVSIPEGRLYVWQEHQRWEGGIFGGADHLFEV